MKNTIFCILALLCTSLFAVSYANNTYQKLADEYTKKAQVAFDAGEYDLSVDYAKKAQENAALSAQFIAGMRPKADAEEELKKAQDKVDWAKSIEADKNYPVAYSAATQALQAGKDAFAKEDYVAAADYARQSQQALSEVGETNPLPQYYIVRPWAQSKDCFWNISGRSYIYNNPRLWENLYQANKQKLPNANDPNLLLPSTKLEIPSITGEHREGVYDPNKSYPTYQGK